MDVPETSLLQIHTINSLSANKTLFDQLFQDRAQQFCKRLKWDLKRDDFGREIDQYDNTNSVYILWIDPEGNHQGSLRLMPTSSQSMICDHFSGHFQRTLLPSNNCWEVTRFCISPQLHSNAARRASRELVKSAFIFCAEKQASSLVGLCFPTMLRVYRRLGCAPSRIETSHQDQALIFAEWDVSFSRILDLYSKKCCASEANLVHV